MEQQKMLGLDTFPLISGFLNEQQDLLGTFPLISGFLNEQQDLFL